MRNLLPAALCSLMIPFSLVCLAQNTDPGIEVHMQSQTAHVIAPAEPPSPYDTNLSSVTTTPSFDEQVASTATEAEVAENTTPEFNPEVAVISTPFLENKYTLGTQIPLLNADSSMKITPAGYAKTWCERHPERCAEHHQKRTVRLTKHCKKNSGSQHCVSTVAQGI